MNQTQFASRFSLEDWGLLCGHQDFNAAVADGEFTVAEVIAHRLLHPQPSPPPDDSDEARRLEAIRLTFGSAPDTGLSPETLNRNPPGWHKP